MKRWLKNLRSYLTFRRSWFWLHHPTLNYWRILLKYGKEIFEPPKEGSDE